MGGGGYVEPPRPVREVEKVFKRTVKVLVETEKAEYDRRIDQLQKEGMKEMKEAGKKIDPNINDHGVGHVERVYKTTEEVERTLDDISVTKEQIGRLQSEEEKFVLRSTAIMHDIGRSAGSDKEHALESSKIIRSRPDLFPNSSERNNVARLAELHNQEGTRHYGTDNLAELARKGIISKKEALQASILRIADALDAGKKRVETNSQGEPANQVIDRIKKTIPKSQQKYLLPHWYGHKGIVDAKPKKENSKFVVNIKFDSKYLKSHGSDVAFRVKDMFSDINTTVTGRKYGVIFSCSNKEQLNRWYGEYHELFAEEMEGVEVSCKQA